MFGACWRALLHLSHKWGFPLHQLNLKNAWDCMLYCLWQGWLLYLLHRYNKCVCNCLSTIYVRKIFILGVFGQCKYVYYGKHSEGNRFIRNNQLWLPTPFPCYVTILYTLSSYIVAISCNECLKNRNCVLLNSWYFRHRWAVSSIWKLSFNVELGWIIWASHQQCNTTGWDCLHNSTVTRP